MNTTLFKEILHQITQYVSALDWTYILTFIIIAYGVNNYRVKRGIQKATGVKTKTRYRIALIGLVYGAILYFLRGYGLSDVETLLQSFVFALVFHKLMLDGLIGFVQGKISKKRGKHQTSDYHSQNHQGHV